MAPLVCIPDKILRLLANIRLTKCRGKLRIVYVAENLASDDLLVPREERVHREGYTHMEVQSVIATDEWSVSLRFS